ncbi:MtnX-like HAD-IB family phosphatase [Chloroflexota bacterium]
MQSKEIIRTMVQCDFDGTITEKDISFLILDAFTNGDWRQMFKDYKGGKITVGNFNKRAFEMVKEGEKELKEFVLEKYRVREGFLELLEYCRQRDFRFVIVSNGLEFYIKAILESMGIDNIDVFAARAVFNQSGLEASYMGPDGRELDEDFKKAYIISFLKNGYRIIYIGNGASDVASAKLADHVFATDSMLTECQRANMRCTAFSSLRDIVRGLRLIN